MVLNSSSVEESKLNFIIRSIKANMNSITNKHKHIWKEVGNYLVCECGKKKLKLESVSSNLYKGTKSDGLKYKVRSNRDRIFYPQEWIDFLSNLKPMQTFTFKLLLLTGARIMEAQNIKVEDIDFANQRIVLRKTKQRSGENIINKSKTRTLRVSSELIRDIKRRVTELSLKKDNLLGILSQPAAHQAMQKALYKTKIKDFEMFSVHSIRKTSENWALAMHIDSMTLSTRFGHNLTTQYEHYSQSDAFNQKEKDMIRELYGDTFIE